MSKTATLPLLAMTLAFAACEDMPTAPAQSDGLVAVVAAPGAGKPTFSDAAKPGMKSIVMLASETAALSTLVNVILYSDGTCGTGFAAALSSEDDDYTVFAPTNDAFAALIGALGEATVLSCDVLPTVLAFHVTNGRHHSKNVLKHKRFRMLSGEWAAVDADALTIAGAGLNLGLIDISASNGIVHVVDDVLLPGSILAALGD